MTSIERFSCFKLFANCIPVKGYGRSTICDLQRHRIHLIPNNLFDILVDNDYKTVDLLLGKFGSESANVIEEYFNFLIREELIFFTEEPELFPELDKAWYSPSIATNCIIDLDSFSDYNLQPILNQLSELDCKDLEVRLYSWRSLIFLQTLIDFTEGSTLTSIRLIIPFNLQYTENDLILFSDKNLRITSVVIYNSPEPKVIESTKYAVPLQFITNNIKDERCCGKIYAENFVANISTFTESLNHNTCLNRKISIDTKGNVKNCPSMNEDFGNVAEITLEEVLNKPNFRRYWNLTKDHVNICKECEFRHVCTDCRAYLEHPEDNYSKPLKCGYNPYTCIWEDWSTSPLKQAAIAFYNLSHSENEG